MRYSFKNDYSEGCHPKILEKILNADQNLQQNGYGDDEYSKNAAKLILEKCNSPASKVFFVSGGTQANLLVISALLKSYESVISSENGHICSNETGAIEHSGHKILSIPKENGKLAPENILPVLESHTNFPHQVKPKLVYISNSTELGTVYTKEELQHLSNFCREKQLFLFMDGARLGQALTIENADLSLEDLAKLTDVFYIGGTKNGAMFGEAVVVNKSELLEDFGFHMKQKGALLAKGRFVGLQFEALFEGNLFFDLAKNANSKAQKIKNTFQENGFGFLAETSSNQIFPILKNSQIRVLENHFDFYIWKKIDDDRSAIRLVTSWATSDNIVEKFCSEIVNLKNK